MEDLVVGDAVELRDNLPSFCDRFNVNDDFVQFVVQEVTLERSRVGRSFQRRGTSKCLYSLNCLCFVFLLVGAQVYSVSLVFNSEKFKFFKFNSHIHWKVF